MATGQFDNIRRRVPQYFVQSVVLTFGGVFHAGLLGFMAVSGKYYAFSGAVLAVGTFLICGLAAIRWSLFWMGKMLLDIDECNEAVDEPVL